MRTGRHKGGEARAHQLGHEGFVEMGKKGGLAGHGHDPYQAAAKQGVHIDEPSRAKSWSQAELAATAWKPRSILRKVNYGIQNLLLNCSF
jgi:hypothetical protein